MDKKRLEEIEKRLQELKDERDKLNEELETEKEIEREALLADVNNAYKDYMKAYEIFRDLRNDYLSKYNTLKVSYRF